MSSSLNKLRFKVVSFTSEDADYPASQLNTVNPSTRGWQSVRFCSYPQELGFELLDGECKLSQIQILSHQSKIPLKVELYIGQGNNYQSATFKRLGYLSLDSNERSSYQARELKTVFVDCVGSFVKLVINDNYVNKLNIYNQVGVVALSLMGFESNANPLGAHNSGNPPGRPVVSNPYNDLSIDMNLDPQTAGKLRQLADAKARAIESEDYLTAKQIKSVEQELKSLGSRLAQLNMAKSAAVSAEDYDLAKDIKDESDQLRSEIENKISVINIPGVAPAKPATRHDHRSLVQNKYGAENKGSGDDHYNYSSPRSGYDGTAPPVNIDDMPVGPGSAGQGPGGPIEVQDPRFNAPGSGSSKRAVKVEQLHHPGFDDKIGLEDKGGLPGEPDPYAHLIDEDSHAHLPPTERPIVARDNTEFASVGGIDDDPNAYQSGSSKLAKPAEQFAPGEHPLEGLPGFLDLPTPEALSSKTRESAETGGITALIGEYRARCLFSKTWVLREAAINKVLRMVPTDFVFDPPGIGNCLMGLSSIIRVGVEDKIQQVLFGSITLMDEVLKATRGAKLPRSTVVQTFDPIIHQLVEKLADGNARLRDGSRKGLETLAASNNVGPGPVAGHTLRALPGKQKNMWRPISARLQMLTELVRNYGVGGNTGLNVEALLAFPKTTGSFAHSTAEVRDEAKRLVVAIHKEVGPGPLQATLQLLRPKQLEEYEAAFNSDGRGPGANSSPGGDGGKAGAVARTDKHLQHATHAPGGKVPTTAARVTAHNKQDGDDLNSNNNNNAHSLAGNKHSKSPSKSGDKSAAGGDNDVAGTAGGGGDFTTCMFCGVHDANWNENDLDVHYWKDCPLLISCPSCAQIVEIAGLPEHLLDECDAKESYVPCDTTGLAIRATEFEAWKSSSNCVAAPNNCMYCPLCLASVEDSDEAWLSHLTKGCPRNTRTNGS